MSAEDYVRYILAFLLATIAVGRIARLLTHDDFPPTAWFREKWVGRTGDTWGPLLLCPFCIGPYLAAIDIAWYLLADAYWDAGFAAWWIGNAVAALAYTSAMLVVRDEPE